MAKEDKSPDKAQSLPLSIVDDFFPAKPGVSAPDQLPLVKISRVVQNQGVSLSHLSQALSVLISVMSSRLGDPVPVVITEDPGAGAIEFLDTCLKLVPDNSWVDVTAIARKGSSMDQRESGKTVICYDGDRFGSELMSIIEGVERGRAWTSKGNVKSSSTHSSMGFVALVKDSNHPILQNRYVMRVHINADEDSKKKRMEGIAGRTAPDRRLALEIESACVRTLFGRASSVPVDIEFAGKIMADSASKIQNAVPIYDLSLRLIRNLARINNIVPLRPYEQQLAFLGLDYSMIFPSGAGGDVARLVARKVDYYYFLSVFGDILRSGNDYLTPRQLEIYTAILNYNLQIMAKNKKQYPTPIIALNHIHEFPSNDTWVAREELYGILQSGTGERFSEVTLHNELQNLLDKELIVRMKSKHRRYAFQYAVSNLIDYAPIFTTDFSQIVDSKYKKAEVVVTDIVTGEKVNI